MTQRYMQSFPKPQQKPRVEIEMKQPGIKNQNFPAGNVPVKTDPTMLLMARQK